MVAKSDVDLLDQWHLFQNTGRACSPWAVRVPDVCRGRTGCQGIPLGIGRTDTVKSPTAFRLSGYPHSRHTFAHRLKCSIAKTRGHAARVGSAWIGGTTSTVLQHRYRPWLHSIPLKLCSSALVTVAKTINIILSNSSTNCVN